MTLRRRLALLIDPTIALQPEPEPLRFDPFGYHSLDMARALQEIAKSTASLDAKTRKRRPRIVNCTHPELHPELRAV